MTTSRPAEEFFTELAHENQDIRMFAAQLLGIDPGGAVAYLVEALSDTSPAVRAVAAYSLGELEVPGSVPSLLVALTDPDPAMRSNAAEALGKLGDACVVEGLTDPDDATRANAANSLYHVDTTVSALTQLEDSFAAPAMIVQLKAPDSCATQRRTSAKALGMLDHFAAVPTLIRDLEDEAYKVREDAGGALGLLRDVAAVRYLIGSLQYEHSGVRGSAVRALGQLGDPRALDPLVICMADL